MSYDKMMEALAKFTSNKNAESVGKEGAENMLLGGTLLRDIILGTIKR